MGAHTSARRAHTREALDALRRIVLALRESSRNAERRVGVTGAQLFVLETLAAAPPLSMNELAERTRTHQSSVSTVVARLARQGLVRRARDPEDTRRVQLTVSPEGRRLVGRAPDVAQTRLIRALDALPAASRRTLADALAEVARGVTQGRRAPAMFFDPLQKGRPRE
jgi:DNA-binding MarR family transcriptional regulator